jgi:Mg-chelatase subunit ChlD
MEGDETECQIKIQPPDSSERLPIHIVYCIDTSGSMSKGLEKSGFLRSKGTKKIEAAQRGVKQALEQLTGEDRFGIVSFSNSAKTITTGEGSRIDDAQEQIQRVSAGGGTNIQAGLDKSRDLLYDMRDPIREQDELIEWIVLVSDGHGKIDLDRVANAFGNEGVPIFSAGVGNKYKEKIIREISKRSRGNSRHVSSAEELEEFFSAQVEKARDVVVTAAEVTIRLHNGVNVTEAYYTLSGQVNELEPDRVGDKLRIDLSDLQAQTPEELLLSLEVPPTDPVRELTLLEIMLQTNAFNDSTKVEATVSAPALIAPDDHDEGVGKAFAIAKASHLTREGHTEEARAITRAAKQEYGGDKRISKLEETGDELSNETDVNKERKMKDEASRALARWDEDS